MNTPIQQMDRQHIFAVNGSPDFLDIIRELLQLENYNVTTTNFVPKTHDQIAALNPSLLLIDLVVGERIGWDLLEHLAGDTSTQGIPVIVVSTSPRILAEAQENTARFGGQRFLLKPFDLEDLLTVVAELIGPA